MNRVADPPGAQVVRVGAGVLFPIGNIAVVLALVFASAIAQAQSEIVLDNVAPVFGTTGTWPASTAVSG